MNQLKHMLLFVSLFISLIASATSYTVSSIPYMPYPFTGGTTLPLGDDENSAPIPLGFSFQFFDQTHTSVIINSNAVLGFSAIPTLRTRPQTNLREIYVNMHDINPGTPSHPGIINYYTLGTAPNRVFVVNYYDIVKFGSACSTHNYTGQVVLHETSNNIDIYLQQKDSCNGVIPESCIGVADTGGVNIYAPGRTHTTWYAENEGWRFCYDGVCTTAGMVDFSYIKGKVYYDADNNCSLTLGETGISSSNIELYDTISGSYLYASTDVAGNYTALANNGYWRVRLLPSPYVIPNTCADQFVLIDTTTDSGIVNLAATIRPCPYLSTNISASIIRPCSTATHYISYFNGGSTSPITYIDITLDTPLVFSSSSIPLLSSVGNTYRFDLGSVPYLSGGNFTINSIAPCWVVLNQTLCAEAHIYPDTLCPPPPTGWDSSNLDANVYEDTIGIDSVVFTVKNIGSGDMSMPTVITVVEDLLMIVSSPISLNAGQEQKYKYPSNGKMYRLQALQTLNNPYKTYTAASIEGATESSSDTISYGLINSFPLDDEPISIDITCNEVRTSFDPNMKSATPTGITSNHLLEKNTPIKYRVDFQNTGNDTAFYVAIIDSLSPLLQAGTLQFLSSSHPCTYNLVNNKVRFEFNNIRLIDSTTDEPASHGFVEFGILQVPDLVDGSVIYNFADIVFDVNIPVRTNTVFHTIGRLINTGFTSHHPEYFNIQAYPNPFENEVRIVSDQIDENTSLTIYNIEGKVVYTAKGANREFVIYRKDLVKGMYIYEITRNSTLLGTGKLIAE